MWPDLVVSWPLYKFYIESNRDIEHLNIERKKFLLPIIKKRINEKNRNRNKCYPYIRNSYLYSKFYRIYIVTFDSNRKEIYWSTWIIMDYTHISYFTYNFTYNFLRKHEKSTEYAIWRMTKFGSNMAYNELRKTIF